MFIANLILNQPAFDLINIIFFQPWVFVIIAQFLDAYLVVQFIECTLIGWCIVVAKKCCMPIE